MLLGRNSLLILLGLLVLNACNIFRNSDTTSKTVVELETFKDSIPDLFANTINQKDLNKHLSIIASDEYEGRETARPGQKKAAKYIADRFKEFGVAPGNDTSYFQTFGVDAKNPVNVFLTIDDLEFKIIDDYYYTGNLLDTSITAEIIYIGNGNSEADYEKADVQDKIVLFEENSAEDIGWRVKYKLARIHGAVGIMEVKSNYNESVEIVKTYLEDPTMEMHHQGRRQGTYLPYIYVNDRIKNVVLDTDSVKKATIKVNIQEDLTSDNVLGFIEGSDLKDEIVIITAHYDHLGYDNGEVCNGADDDGTGTVSVIELAEAFQKAKEAGYGPRRSMLFMTVSGEEKGLWGSRYYTDHPVYSLEKTIVDLNIDMVGRRDDHHKNDNYVYLIGSDRISNDLHLISEKVNDRFIQFEIDYTYNQKDDPNQFYYRSDHYNFAKNNIPVIFYFSGVHEDYHKPTDDVEKINFSKLEKTARLVFYTAWEIANREEKLRKNAK